MIGNLFGTLAELGLLSPDGLRVAEQMGVKAGSIKAASKLMAHPKLTAFYSALARMGKMDSVTIMTIAEEYLSEVAVSQPTIGGLSAYDVLRHKLLLGNASRYLIIYGSLSGIQDYLFDVKSSHALKQLRGRSFYLYLLQDAIVECAVREFGVTRHAVLYSTGGTFCMLIPYQEGIETQFHRFKHDITKRVFEAHRQTLVLLNGNIVTSADLTERLPDVFSALHQQKNTDKYTPLCGVLQDMYEACFAPQQDSPVMQAHDCAEALGAVLGKMKYMLIAPQHLQQSNALLVINPANLGVYYHLLPSCTMLHDAISDSSLSMIAYNDAPIPQLPIGCRREYFAGIGASAQSFADLLDRVPDGGIKRLGILRMDVDNLGYALRKCYEGENALAQYAKMSRRLDCFFKQTLNRLWLQQYKDASVIVYSGGDDLFIVGEWSQTIQAAHEINRQYRTNFADADLTLSGGISVVDEKFPIIRAAEYSAEEERQAKKFIYVDANGCCHQKNTLSIFGMPLRWDVEWPIVNEIYQKLAHLTAKNESLYRPFARRILKYFEAVHFEQRQIVPIRQVWLMTYDLSRAIKRIDHMGGEVDKQFLTQCKNDLVVGVSMLGKTLDSPYHALQLWAVAARLVELTTRNNIK